jgi:hypothetical protein
MDKDPLDALKADRDAFAAKLPELLLTHAGKFALFKSGAFVDAYDSMDGAYKAGLTKFGLERFYIGHIATKQKPEQIPALMLGVIRACV